MRSRGVVAVVVGILLAGGWSPGGWGAPAAQAQDQMPLEPKGMSTKGLVSSTGGFSARLQLPIVLTGQVVELAPGGHTGRHRFLVPAYMHVLEGTLTTDIQGGPVGVAGIQYHAGGQSVPLPPPGVWQNFYNSGSAPVRYLVIFLGTPGGPTMEQAKAEE